jgi:NAD(P)-dependent dehydrogenase (short-subunit alcohol dehydrogenase family)
MRNVGFIGKDCDTTVLASQRQVERLVEQHIDVLFNNAGSFNSIAGVTKAPD